MTSNQQSHVHIIPTSRKCRSINDIGIDLLQLEIFTRLTPKIVGRCKCVCKVWLASLGANKFLQSHCRRMSVDSNKRVFITVGRLCASYKLHIEDPYDKLDLRFIQPPFNLDSPYNIQFLASLHGLVCVCLKRTPDMVLWNPLTKAFKNVTDENSHGLFQKDRDAIGLYVDATNDYNILHIKQHDGVVDAFIYSRRLHCWRAIGFLPETPYGNLTYDWDNGVLCGDFIYFTVLEYRDKGNYAIIAFNVNTEEFKEIAYPHYDRFGVCTATLFNLNDELRMFVSFGHNVVVIKMLKFDGINWMFDNSFPFTTVGVSRWLSITHVLAAGRWFMFSYSQSAYRISTESNSGSSFCPLTWIRGKGGVYTETILAPYI